MNEKIAEHAAEVLKAIAHPIRLQVVELLQAKEMCLGDIAENLGGKQDITSQQLNMMKVKGVLSCSRLEIGGNIFFGDYPNTFFGQFQNNTNVYLGLRYSF